MKRWSFAAVAAVFFAVSGVRAESEQPLPSLHKPAQIRLLANSGTAGRPEIAKMLGLLQATLCLPVSIQKVEFDPSKYLDADRGQLDGGPIVADIKRNFSGTSAVNILFVDEDLYDSDAKWRYLFADSEFSMESGQGWSVVSLARVANPFRQETVGQGADRLFKLALRLVVRAAGFDGEKGCLLDFPNSPEKLDQLPSKFCPWHEKALTEAGIIGCIGV